MKTKCMALLLSIGVFTSLVGCRMREVTEDEVYEKFELVIVDFLENDVLTASNEAETTGGVYEHVSDLSSKSDWF